MVRKCHLHAWPVGIATKDAVLRAKFNGQPERIVDYFVFVAEEVRELMARLGCRTVNELVGRTELLHARIPETHWKARHLDLSPLLHVPVPSDAAAEPPARRSVRAQQHGLDGALDHQLLALAADSLPPGHPSTAPVDR